MGYVKSIIGGLLVLLLVLLAPTMAGAWSSTNSTCANYGGGHYWVTCNLIDSDETSSSTPITNTYTLDAANYWGCQSGDTAYACALILTSTESQDVQIDSITVSTENQTQDFEEVCAWRAPYSSDISTASVICKARTPETSWTWQTLEWKKTSVNSGLLMKQNDGFSLWINGPAGHTHTVTIVTRAKDTGYQVRLGVPGSNWSTCTGFGYMEDDDAQCCNTGSGTLTGTITPWQNTTGSTLYISGLSTYSAGPSPDTACVRVRYNSSGSPGDIKAQSCGKQNQGNYSLADGLTVLANQWIDTKWQVTCVGHNGWEFDWLGYIWLHY